MLSPEPPEDHEEREREGASERERERGREGERERGRDRKKQGVPCPPSRAFSSTPRRPSNTGARATEAPLQKVSKSKVNYHKSKSMITSQLSQVKVDYLYLFPHKMSKVGYVYPVSAFLSKRARFAVPIPGWSNAIWGVRSSRLNRLAGPLLSSERCTPV